MQKEEIGVNSPGQAQDSGIAPFSVLARAALAQPPVPGEAEEGGLERDAH